MAITTVDGVIKKPGTKCWYIACGLIGYYPKQLIVSPMDKQEDLCYFHDKKLCQEQCDLLNQSNKI